MAAHFQKLWLIVNHDGHIVHQTPNPEHVELMKRYVCKSIEAGDDWTLREYTFEKVVPCNKQQSKVASAS